MPSSQCYENAAAQGTAGALAALAVGIVGVCTFNNCFLREQRARRVFPGRLVTILGGIITVMEAVICMGWAVGWKQLNYRLDDMDDDSEGGQYKALCLTQGFLFQSCLMAMVMYSFWICVTFYFVIDRRHRHNLFLESVKRHRHVELGVHAAIGVLSVSLAALALGRGLISGASGAPSCWIESRLQQMLFFYVAEVLTLGLGVVFSVRATRELCKIVRTAPPDPSPSLLSPPPPGHNTSNVSRNSSNNSNSGGGRSLRRVVYANIAWTVSVLIIGLLPVLALVFGEGGMAQRGGGGGSAGDGGDYDNDGGDSFCWLAYVSVASVGLFFAFDFHFLPSCFESSSSSSSSSRRGRSDSRGRFGQPRFFQTDDSQDSGRRHYFAHAGSPTSTLTDSQRSQFLQGGAAAPATSNPLGAALLEEGDKQETQQQD
jgi:hypothetical protein